MNLIESEIQCSEIQSYKQARYVYSTVSTKCYAIMRPKKAGAMRICVCERQSKRLQNYYKGKGITWTEEGVIKRVY